MESSGKRFTGAETSITCLVRLMHYDIKDTVSLGETHLSRFGAHTMARFLECMFVSAEKVDILTR